MIHKRVFLFMLLGLFCIAVTFSGCTLTFTQSDTLQLSLSKPTEKAMSLVAEFEAGEATISPVMSRRRPEVSVPVVRASSISTFLTASLARFPTSLFPNQGRCTRRFPVIVYVGDHFLPHYSSTKIGAISNRTEFSTLL